MDSTWCHVLCIVRHDRHNNKDCDDHIAGQKAALCGTFLGMLLLCACQSGRWMDALRTTTLFACLDMVSMSRGSQQGLQPPAQRQIVGADHHAAAGRRAGFSGSGAEG